MAKKVFSHLVLSIGLSVFVSCMSTNDAVVYEEPTPEANVFVEVLGGVKKAVASGSTVKLRSDFTIEDILIIPANVIFDLTNGKKLILGNGAILTVEGTLNVKGANNDSGIIIKVTSSTSRPATINGNGNIYLKSQGNLIRVNPSKKLIVSGNIILIGIQNNNTALALVGGELILEGNAVINGNKNPNGAGGGVYLGKFGEGSNGGVLILNENASITNNNAGIGGGVALTGANCSFIMNGGSITNNVTDSGGAGIRVAGSNSKFIKTGGKIIDNRVTAGETYGHSIAVIEWDPPYIIRKYCDRDISDNLSVTIAKNGKVIADISGEWLDGTHSPKK
ncbi:hypothetical protein [Treponema primitia]|uniref:hypothetical protein n=1 Tax=Treponema primitia TaxID=88058 RepID=UPI0002555864|nr:hypothetical protein [Treponema primitia]